MTSNDHNQPYFTFWVFLHISGMGETRVLKLYTQVGHMKYEPVTAGNS